MSATLMRRMMTAQVITSLTGVQVDGSNQLVGHTVLPQGAGWAGEPNSPTSIFAPFTVCKPLVATPSADAGGARKPQADWHLPYQVTAYGITPEQVEWLADENRRALGPLLHQELSLGDETYKVQQVWTGQIGSVEPVLRTDPAWFGQADSVTVWVAYKRS